MTPEKSSARITPFVVRFILPTTLTMALFLIAFFSFIIPTIENNSLDRKREMIRELTNAAWNIFATLENEVQQGLVDRNQAKRQAMEQISNLHYGTEMKDYFWINDMHPNMVIHPYRPDLNGTDLSNYIDPEGKHIFIEMVKLVDKEGSGFVEYIWQWQDDEKRIQPKISYVKGFKPWGWIIGTGAYIDDVKAEIKTITDNLIQVSLFILFIISLLLAFIANQSYRAMKKQQIAEKALRESEEKYRTLVESAAEGMFMSLEGCIMYANQTLADLLGYTLEELSGMDTEQLFLPEEDVHNNFLATELLHSSPLPERFETKFQAKDNSTLDITLSATSISLGGRNGFMAIVSDITKRKKETDQLGASEEKFRTMANNLNVGFFRMNIAAKNPKFIEANPALLKMLGHVSKGSLYSVPVSDFYYNPDDFKNPGHPSFPDDVKRRIVRLSRKDGSVFHASIWGVRTLDKHGKPLYFDGILEDITDVIKREQESRKLISQMQSALMYHNRQLVSLELCRPKECSPQTPIWQVAEAMNTHETSIMLVRDSELKYVGFVQDTDIRRLLSSTDTSFAMNQPVSTIMSIQIPKLPEKASVMEAWAYMKTNISSHVFTIDTQYGITGMVTDKDLLAIQHHSPSVLMDTIQKADNPDTIISANTLTPFLLTTLIESGAKPQNINRLTALISDSILVKFIQLAIAELGQPPAAFSFIVFGSVGREEQTLKTDQDNAIIYEDISSERAPHVREYFLTLGKKVCTWLNDAGYTFCEGNNMAMNPEYCQPISIWKQYFSKWVFSVTAEDLLRVKIFFDFRKAYGDDWVEDELRLHLEQIASENSRFFQMLARDILQMAPPIGLFGNFVVESSGPKRGAFEIKSAMMPIVDFARIYAIKNKIRTANTIQRLDTLRDLKILNDINHQEMIQAYSYLMQTRLGVQAKAISSGKIGPSNYVFPKSLTSIEQKMLKEIFSQTKNFQVKLSYDFTGQLNS